MFITSVVAALVQRVEQMITVVQTVRNEEMELLWKMFIPGFGWDLPFPRKFGINAWIIKWKRRMETQLGTSYWMEILRQKR
jgi:hypothetical protein